MEEFRFEWDVKKSRANEVKHDVSFEEARTAFFDDHARIVEDWVGPDGEQRLVLLGLTVRLRVREPDRIIRIISARKADPSERLEYSRNLP